MEKHRDEKEWRGVDLRNGHVDETRRLECTGSMAECLLVQEIWQGPNMVTSQGATWPGEGLAPSLFRLRHLMLLKICKPHADYF